MQAIAAENNLAETAFFVPEPGGYRLRWFTPAVEVDLCGHATLAAGYVIMSLLHPGSNEVWFESRSGGLRVLRNGDLYTLDFPSRPPERTAGSAEVSGALGRAPLALYRARDLMAVYESEEEVRSLSPDMKALARLDAFATIVTAPGKHVDFVSRFFAPGQGIDEDPVTGSAHCTLVPYWSARLGKKQLHALQVSRRGGELWCGDEGARITISGHVALYLRGEAELP
jgi:PhzF family phenazine biosynthesis protein